MQEAKFSKLVRPWGCEKASRQVGVGQPSDSSPLALGIALSSCSSSQKFAALRCSTTWSIASMTPLVYRHGQFIAPAWSFTVAAQGHTAHAGGAEIAGQPLIARKDVLFLGLKSLCRRFRGPLRNALIALVLATTHFVKLKFSNEWENCLNKIRNIPVCFCTSRIYSHIFNPTPAEEMCPEVCQLHTHQAELAVFCMRNVPFQ